MVSRKVKERHKQSELNRQCKANLIHKSKAKLIIDRAKETCVSRSRAPARHTHACLGMTHTHAPMSRELLRSIGRDASCVATSICISLHKYACNWPVG